mmetsp:Transcript_40405/g.90682  ORF Transcript_40405/g.90682 Transcript_40405/m.90682 type:complete len:201 (+) Transcript_40405:404-1006(+)
MERCYVGRLASPAIPSWHQPWSTPLPPPAPPPPLAAPAIPGRLSGGAPCLLASPLGYTSGPKQQGKKWHSSASVSPLRGAAPASEHCPHPEMPANLGASSRAPSRASRASSRSASKLVRYRCRRPSRRDASGGLGGQRRRQRQQQQWQSASSRAGRGGRPRARAYAKKRRASKESPASRCPTASRAARGSKNTPTPRPTS